jgi:hypothetical protein
MIRFIVDRMPVWTTGREVIAEFRRRFARAGNVATRAQRREVYREALRIHRENQALCREFRL